MRCYSFKGVGKKAYRHQQQQQQQQHQQQRQQQQQPNGRQIRLDQQHRPQHQDDVRDLVAAILYY